MPNNREIKSIVNHPPTNQTNGYIPGLQWTTAHLNIYLYGTNDPIGQQFRQFRINYFYVLGKALQNATQRSSVEEVAGQADDSVQEQVMDPDTSPPTAQIKGYVIHYATNSYVQVVGVFDIGRGTGGGGGEGVVVRKSMQTVCLVEL